MVWFSQKSDNKLGEYLQGNEADFSSELVNE